MEQEKKEILNPEENLEQSRPDKKTHTHTERTKTSRAKQTPRNRNAGKRDYGEMNTMLIRIFLGCGIVLAAVTIALSLMFDREGEQAEANANELLAAYEESLQQLPSPEAATPTPEPEATATPSPEPAETPEASASPEQPSASPEVEEGTELYAPDAEVTHDTDDAADAAAMSGADEHRASDSNDEHVDESSDYVQPDAPETDESAEIIQSIVSKVGEDGIIGLIEIPEIDIKLPVIGKWSYSLLKISVCRYKGPAINGKGNLVVIGHNYKSGAHFGNLDQLSKGSAVYLIEPNGNKVRYEVYDRVTIEPDAFSALDSYKGTSGLTLMTCRNQGNNRLLVRCVQKDADIPEPR